MWTRVELKYRAKNVLRNCFWAAVIVAFLCSLVNGSFSNGSGSSNYSYDYSYDDSYYNGIQESGSDLVDSAKGIITDNVSGLLESPQYLLSKIAGTGLGLIVLGAGIVVVLLGIAFGILVGNPVQVGACRFFMCSRENEVRGSNARVGELLYAFRQREFWNVVLIMLAVNVKTFLWSLLLVIPGIVKRYEYSMIPYILAENPGISMTEAFSMSREMTMGQKMEIFILDLSFLPWELLSSVTLGLAGIFWVNPYVMATKAELYAVRRQDVLEKGFFNAYDLPGFW